MKFLKLPGSDFQMIPTLHKAYLETEYIGLIIVLPFLMQTENDQWSILEKYNYFLISMAIFIYYDHFINYLFLVAFNPFIKVSQHAHSLSH